MALASGMATQLGFVTESAYGVTTTPTRFLPVLDNSLAAERVRIEQEGIIANQAVIRSSQWNGGPISAGGSVGFELSDRSMGLLFEHMFGGTPVTTGPVSGIYTHTFIPVAGGLTGKSMTVQASKIATDGTATAFTYPGTKIASWELAVAADANATLNLDLVSKTENAGVRSVSDGTTSTAGTVRTVTSATAIFTDGDLGKPISGSGIPAGSTIAKLNSATSVEISANATLTATGVTLTIGTALATASYASGAHPLKYNIATVTHGGSTQLVKSITIAGDNMLNADRRVLGNQFRREPLEAGLREYTGTMEVEFDSMVSYYYFVAGVEAALVLDLTYLTNTVRISGNVRLDGATPVSSGRDIMTQTIPFKFVGSTTDASAITAVLLNGDSAP